MLITGAEAKVVVIKVKVLIPGAEAKVLTPDVPYDSIFVTWVYEQLH